MALLLKDYSNKLDQKNMCVTNQETVMIFTAIHLFLEFFLGILSHGGVALEYHD